MRERLVMSWLEHLIVSYKPPALALSHLLVWTWFYGIYKVIYIPLKHRCFMSNDEVGISTFYNVAERESSSHGTLEAYRMMLRASCNYCFQSSFNTLCCKKKLATPHALLREITTMCNNFVRYISMGTFSEFWDMRGIRGSLKCAVMFVVCESCPVQLESRILISFSVFFRK